MTCDDYLSMLETLPVQELAYGEARDHAAYCPECNRVTRVVAARERNMALAYAEAYPSSSALTVAERAVMLARRQRLAFFYRAAAGLVFAGAIAFFGVSRLLPSAAQESFQERFRLQCLSPEQASELIRQELKRDDISISARPPLAVISIEARRQSDLQRAHALLEHYDSPQQARCAAEIVVPKN